ncbi:Mg chelatase subunit ChlI [Calderihabitans maritimus]|uniref:Mg chelatase subunit ChlI n=1 Tax=Calderihabitans maritimus TaxID=1246530 RepID=A0A1Z5HU65_9FIRM|nr:Mg chelatase subunit ChlI [Calderihabitans maritimus]
MDELPEFNRNVLEALRQPLEDKVVTISRAAAALSYPANFMLVAAMNPCPCGFYGDSSKQCSCTPLQIQRYQSKISGPLLDRIDIHIEVPRLEYKEVAGNQPGENSASIRARVERARQIQRERYKSLGINCNAEMSPKLTKKFCSLDKEGQDLIRKAFTQLGLSMRALDRILKVARTIADLEESQDIEPHHVAEAIQYRTLDRRVF